MGGGGRNGPNNVCTCEYMNNKKLNKKNKNETMWF
jgi:hypothetical protein